MANARLAIEVMEAIEDKVRLLTENFKVIQWVLLYHGLGESSFFFRRQKEKSDRVDVTYLDYPQFFKNIFSVKQEWATTMEEVFSTNDAQDLQTLIFGNHFSSPEKPVWVFPITATAGKTPSSKPLATLIASYRNSATHPSSTVEQQRTSEKKMISKLTGILSIFLERERERTALEANTYYRETMPSQDFNAWLDKVASGIKANNYHLYWIGESRVWIHSFSKNGKMKGPKIAELDQVWENWKSLDHGARSGIHIWGRPEIKLHSKIKNKVALQSKKESSLMFVFKASKDIVEKVTGEKKHAKNCFLLVQFTQDGGDGFHDFEYLFAEKAMAEGEKYLDTPSLIASIKAALSLPQKSTKKISPSSTITHHFDLYQKNQLHLAVAQPFFNDRSTRSLIKTDLKPGLQVGSSPSYFKYFRIKKHVNAIDIIHSGINYFHTRSIDLADYGKKLKKFLSESLKDDPLERYIFLSLDSPTLSQKDPLKKSTVGIVAEGFRFLHYSFESGELKKLPNFGYCFSLIPEQEDILLAFPTGVISKEEDFKKLENELVIFGQAFPDKLIEDLGKLINHTEFLVIKKPRLGSIP